MKIIAKLALFFGALIVSNLQAATTFTEGARDTVTLHPSCRTENTGLTAIGVALPVGPEVNVTMPNADGEDVTTVMSLPYSDALITTSRSGDVFNANPIMGASPSFNQAAIFGMDTIQGTVAPYGSKNKTEDTKSVFWKLKGVNSYDLASNSLVTLAYLPAGKLITVELGFALPKFTPESCLVTLNVRGAQLARCDQIDPVTKTVLAQSEPDIRKKRMRLTVKRDLVKKPLPAHCGKGITATVEPTDLEVEEMIAKMGTMTP